MSAAPQQARSRRSRVLRRGRPLPRRLPRGLHRSQRRHPRRAPSRGEAVGAGPHRSRQALAPLPEHDHLTPQPRKTGLAPDGRCAASTTTGRQIRTSSGRVAHPTAVPAQHHANDAMLPPADCTDTCDSSRLGRFTELDLAHDPAPLLLTPHVATDHQGLFGVAVVVGAVEREVAQRGELGLDPVQPGAVERDVGELDVVLRGPVPDS